MCSYCGCDSVPCVARFMSEHAELVNACGELRRAGQLGDRAAVEVAADHLAGLLGPHTHAEEVGLFHVLRRDEDFADTIERLCAEHVRIDELLAAARSGGATAYDAFEHLLRAHIDHEDNGLFPAAVIALAGPEWDRVHALTPPREPLS